MISCEAFRAQFAPGTENPALLEHLRSCDACLSTAAEVDPDAMFRALGGAEMIPPGGVETFVGDVMREVRLRSAEKSMIAAPALSPMRKLALAAALVGAVMTGTLLHYQRGSAALPPAAGPVAAKLTATTTRPVVESYESENATIVEMPASGEEGVAIVMVFDESLPADL